MPKRLYEIYLTLAFRRSFAGMSRQFQEKKDFISKTIWSTSNQLDIVISHLKGSFVPEVAKTLRVVELGHANLIEPLLSVAALPFAKSRKLIPAVKSCFYLQNRYYREKKVYKDQHSDSARHARSLARGRSS